MRRLLRRPLLLCVALGVLALGFALVANSNCFEVDPDGIAWQAYMDYQVQNRQAFSQVGVDAHQGNFDTYYPLNNDFTIPGALYRLAGAEQAPGRIVTYAIYVGTLGVLVFGLAFYFGLEAPAACLAAFIATFFFAPLIVHVPMPTFRYLRLNPHWIQLMTCSVLMVAPLWALDGKWRASRVALLVVPGLAALWAIMSLGAMIIFAAAVAVYGLAAVCFAPNRSALAQRLLAALVALALLLATGALAYLFGLERYSAYHVFGAEFDWDYPSLTIMSILFNPPFGTALIVLGMAGALSAAWTETGRLRQLAIAHAAATVIFWAICAVFFAWTLQSGFRISPPLYFETTLMPFAAVFAAMAIVRVVSGVRRIMSAGWSRSGAAEIALWLFVLAVGGYNLIAAAVGQDRCVPYQFYTTIRSNPIIDHLNRAIGLRPGAAFRGNEATIDFADGPAAVDYTLMHRNNGQRQHETGNDSRLAGLWHYAIPTMYQYFTFITAPYYLVLTEFLSRPQDVQTRSGLLLTQVDARMLKLWGVKYLVTDRAIDAGKDVVSLPLTEGRSVHLIELDGVNLGDYSPTEVRRVADFHSGLVLMHDPQFDGRNTVVTDVTDPAIEGPLVAASGASLTYETYGFRIKARSEGRSVLVLPAQFSRCWTVEGSGAPRLFRANLMQLGLQFSGALDARLVFRHGPLFANACRLQDFEDMTRLEIARGRVVPRIPPPQQAAN
jgi:hypothetical protein